MGSEEWCEADACPAVVCGGLHREVQTSLGTEVLRGDQEPLGGAATPDAQPPSESVPAMCPCPCHDGTGPAHREQSECVEWMRQNAPEGTVS